MKKNEVTNPFIKVGRLKKSVADKAHIKAANIYITKDHLRHIYKSHKKELDSLGISAIDFVQTVTSNYNQIRVGSDQSYLLVIFHENSNVHYVAAITINFIVKKGIWEVRTAQPRNTKEIEKKKRIW